MIRMLAYMLAPTLAVSLPTPALAWGALGHRVSATIAERNISGNTRAHVETIFGPMGLPEASTMPDEQRQNPDPFWQGAASWHRIEVERGKHIADRQPHEGGDAVNALEWAVVTLRDPAASAENRRRALAFAVHLVADTHLPVHFNAEPLGGGDFPVLWFGEQRSMHWAFEEGLLLQKQLSASEYADQLIARTRPRDVTAWWTPEMEVWMNEGIAMREVLYDEVEAGWAPGDAPLNLGFQFVYDWTPDMELRLLQSGIRTAAFLDWIFAEAVQPAD